MGLFDIFKRKSAKWEAVGSWHNGEWGIQGVSAGLMDYLNDMERRNPGTWSRVAESGRELIIHGEHYNYRITASTHEELCLLVERKPK